MRTLITLAAITLTAGACTNPKETSTTMSTTPTSKPEATVRRGNLPVNGVTYYYEIQGEGEPLLLLHGGLGSLDMFGPLLPALARSRQVIAVDLHGHGRTPLGARPRISLIDQGDDLAALLDQLGYPQVDVLGYSFGGGVAFRLAAQHPEKVRRLVIASAGFAQDGYYPEMLPQQAMVGAAMADMMKETPMYTMYAAIAPDAGEFPRLLDAMGELMRTPYNWASDVEKLPMPTMLVFGDSDMFRLEHIVEFYKLLGGGQRDAGWAREHMSKHRLAILPDVTHYELFMSPRLIETVRPFLDGKSTPPSWAEQTDAR
jgi:pimeloyl-ACP methyl ester carboxylesterase